MREDKGGRSTRGAGRSAAVSQAGGDAGRGGCPAGRRGSVADHSLLLLSSGRAVAGAGRQQEELDRCLALLAPLFGGDAALLPAGDASNPGSGEQAGQEEGGEEDAALGGESARRAWEQIQGRYEAAQRLCEDGAARARRFGEELAAAAASGADAQGGGGGAPGAVALPPEGGQPGRSEAAVAAVVGQARTHALKRLAEVSTAQLQQLLDHATDLAAPARCARVT